MCSASDMRGASAHAWWRKDICGFTHVTLCFLRAAAQCPLLRDPGYSPVLLDTARGIGSKVEVHCRRGYTAHGRRSLVLHCADSAAWEPSPNPCTCKCYCSSQQRMLSLPTRTFSLHNLAERLFVNSTGK